MTARTAKQARSPDAAETIPIMAGPTAKARIHYRRTYGQLPGPDVKVRGTAQHVAEKNNMNLARGWRRVQGGPLFMG